MAVEVILRDDVPNLGKIGQVVRVRPGYARNFLFPRGLAVEANRKNLSVLEHQKRVIGVKSERERKQAEGVAAKLEGLRLVVRARVGEEGRLFGSVTNLDVERLLAERGLPGRPETHRPRRADQAAGHVPDRGPGGAGRARDGAAHGRGRAGVVRNGSGTAGGGVRGLGPRRVPAG